MNPPTNAEVIEREIIEHANRYAGDSPARPSDVYKDVQRFAELLLVWLAARAQADAAATNPPNATMPCARSATQPQGEDLR